MKKFAVLLLAMCLLCSLLTGCSTISSLLRGVTGNTELDLGDLDLGDLDLGDLDLGDLDLGEFNMGAGMDAVVKPADRDSSLEGSASEENDFVAIGETDGDDLIPHVMMYNLCLAANYGIEADYSVSYRRVYESEEAMMAGENPIAVVGPEDSRYENHCDPTWASLYPITNFSLDEEIREYLSQYLTDHMIAGFELPTQFYDGTLYEVVGGVGAGAYLVGTDGMEVTEQTGGHLTLKAQTLYFDEYVGDAYLYFTNDGGQWKLDSADLAE